MQFTISIKWNLVPLALILVPFFVHFQTELAHYLYDCLCSIQNVRVYGPAPSKSVNRAALCSFNVEGVHPTDIATFLDQQVRVQLGTYLLMDLVVSFVYCPFWHIWEASFFVNYSSYLNATLTFLPFHLPA